MTEATTSQQASVAPQEGTLKRSIQMKLFGAKADRLKAQMQFEAADSPTRGDAARSAITVGLILGAIFSVKERVGTLPSGEVKTSLLAIGDFEATDYSSGEVWNSTSAYLPAYFAEAAKEALDKGSPAVEFAIEVVIVPTGKSVPIAYEVRPLIRRAPTSAINQMKLKLQQVGRLPASLPAPEVVQLALPGGAVDVTAEVVEPADGDDGEAEAEAPAKGKNKAA